MPAKYRGVHVDYYATTPQLREVTATYGANLLRHQVLSINREVAQRDLSRLDEFITNTTKCRYIPALFWSEDPNYTSEDFWHETAPRYKGNQRVLGYDLFNEPPTTESQSAAMMKRLHAIIRQYDPNKKVFISSAYGDPAKFRKVPIIADSNVYYTAHMYYPFEVTHQGVLPQYPVGPNYPSTEWNKDSLVRWLRHMRAFQVNNRVKIYIGEFSCSKFAETSSKLAYIKDCIDIFNDYGWLWTYHCWGALADNPWNPTPDVLELLKNGWTDL